MKHKLFMYFALMFYHKQSRKRKLELIRQRTNMVVETDELYDRMKEIAQFDVLE